MQSTSEARIRVRDLVKTFPLPGQAALGLKNALLRLPYTLFCRRSARRFAAVDGVSFEVGQGETLGLCGPNASGKSTLLALVAGVLRPTSGRVEVNGALRPLLGVGAGFHPELTGRENVFLQGLLIGLPRRQIAAAFDDIVAFSGLGGFIDAPLRTYSLGMMMRLGFSVLVHAGPEILLVDEVLAVGDRPFQEKCVARIRELQKQGVMILLVSHQYALVKDLCSRVLILVRGRIHAEGKPAEMEPVYAGLKSQDAGLR